jgi:hypothetical protein
MLPVARFSKVFEIFLPIFKGFICPRFWSVGEFEVWLGEGGNAEEK